MKMNLSVMSLSMGLFCLFFTNFSICQTAKKLVYPKAKRTTKINKYHNVEVEDPYQWMEDGESADLQTWLKAQDQLYHQMIDKEAKEKYHKLINKFEKFHWHEPYREFGGKFFYRVKGPGEQQEKIYMLDHPEDPFPKLVFNPYVDLPDGASFLGVFHVDPKARYLAFFYHRSSSWHTIRIKDLKTGKILEEEIPGLLMLGLYRNILWDKKGKGFYYVQFDRPPEGRESESTISNPRIKYHKLGTTAEADPIIFQKENTEKYIYYLKMSHDKNYLVIKLREQIKSGHQIYIKKLNSNEEPRLILSDETAKFFYVANKGKKFWFSTNKDAPNEKVISFHLDDSKNWTEVLPEGPNAISTINFVGDRMVVKVIEAARQQLKVYGMDGKYQRDINFPKAGHIGFGPDAPNSPFTYSLLIGPFFASEIYQINSHTGEAKLMANGGGDFQPDDFVIKQVFYPSKDGTKIPMFISYKKDMKRDGKNPTFLYAYGAYGRTPFPWFSSQMIAFLDQGGVYAHANIRGGGEYGEDWHQAGIKTNKQNGVDDYVAAAEWLIKENFTEKKKIVANGNSASGSLAAAAALQRPDLFGAAIINVPTLDMLRFSLFTGGQAKVPEFGDVNKPEEFKALLDYSPYHQLKEEKCFPPFLVQVGEKDRTSVPMHGYKFVAAMQHLQNCNNPVLLRIAWGAGHGPGNSIKERIIENAEELAFIEKMLNKN